MSTNDAIATLEKASKGLTYESESDEPFESFVWKQADGDLTSAKVLKRVRKAARTPVEKVELDDFFQDLTADQDWHGDEEKAAVEQYKKLLAVLKKQLKDPAVFKVGRKQVVVYVVGATDEGDWAGLKTTAVET